MAEAISLHLLESRIGCIDSKRDEVCDRVDIQYSITFKTIFQDLPPSPLPVFSL